MDTGIPPLSAKVLNFPVSQFPASIIFEDERGIDGVVILPEGNKKKVLIGARLASTKEKSGKHDTKEGMDEAFEKASSTLQIEGQTKER